MLAPTPANAMVHKWFITSIQAANPPVNPAVFTLFSLTRETYFTISLYTVSIESKKGTKTPQALPNLTRKDGPV